MVKGRAKRVFTRDTPSPPGGPKGRLGVWEMGEKGGGGS